MGDQQATKYEVGWLAGIIDGEGYLGMIACNDVKRYGGVQIDIQLHICNTDEAIILKAQNIFRSLGINPYIRASRGANSKSKDIYKIQLKHFSKMEKLLNVVFPFLTGNKQKIAELMLEFISLRLNNKGEKKIEGDGRERSGRIHPYTDREIAIYEECQTLQQKGASETTRRTQRNNNRIWKKMRERRLNGTSMAQFTERYSLNSSQ